MHTPGVKKREHLAGGAGEGGEGGRACARQSPAGSKFGNKFRKARVSKGVTGPSRETDKNTRKRGWSKIIPYRGTRLLSFSYAPENTSNPSSKRYGLFRASPTTTDLPRDKANWTLLWRDRLPKHNYGAAQPLRGTRRTPHV